VGRESLSFKIRIKCRVVNKLNEHGLEMYTDFAKNSRSSFEDIIDEQLEDVRYLLVKK